MRAVVLCAGSFVLRSGPELLRSGPDLLCAGSRADLRSGPGAELLCPGPGPELLRSGPGALRCSVVLRPGPQLWLRLQCRS